MAYTYKGTLTGEKDPWAGNPRPNQPRVPGLIWSSAESRWVARIKCRGQVIHVGKFREEDYAQAVEALTTERQRIQAADPAWNTLAPCGTHAAYQRHYRNGEPIDPACRQAEYAYVEAHRKQKAA